MALKKRRWNAVSLGVGDVAEAVRHQAQRSDRATRPVRVLWVGPDGNFGCDADEWELILAPTADAAHQELERATVDIAIISFARDPAAPSPLELLKFLDELRARYPRVIRFALSDNSNRRVHMGATLGAHKTLNQPCDSGSLRQAIVAAANLQERFHQVRLQTAVGGAHRLPSPPNIYLQLNNALRASQRGLDPVVEIIQADPSLTARILQVVNSPALGVGRSVGSVSHAIGLLGVERVRTLILALEMNRSFDGLRQQAEALQRHGFAVADLAARIAGADRSSTAFTAGLLHDVGKLVLMAQMPKEYAVVFRPNDPEPSYTLEQNVWGFSHAEVGAYLLGLWGLPFLLVETVANHHSPHLTDTGRVDLATVVHVADALVHEASGDGSRLDDNLMSQPGAEKKLEAWRLLIG